MEPGNSRWRGLPRRRSEGFFIAEPDGEPIGSIRSTTARRLPSPACISEAGYRNRGHGSRLFAAGCSCRNRNIGGDVVAMQEKYRARSVHTLHTETSGSRHWRREPEGSVDSVRCRLTGLPYDARQFLAPRPRFLAPDPAEEPAAGLFSMTTE